MYQAPKKNALILAAVCSSLIFIAIVFPVQAADGSRVVTIALFVSGMGLKFGSVFVESSAQDSYNEYLSTAVQAEIAKHRDDYTSKRNVSVGMSRTGVGFLGLAVLISIFDQLDLISKTSSQSAALPLRPRFDPRNNETALLFQRQF